VAASVAIIGGGAAGFFLAVALKEACSDCSVTILERSQRTLAKVELSGGGRCNLTNTFRAVSDLRHVYPRGHRLMKRLLRAFSHDDACRWFERHGVALVAQDDDCIFPVSQDAHSISDCLRQYAQRLGVTVRTGVVVDDVKALLSHYDSVCVATGGRPQSSAYDWLRRAGCRIIDPVPSLFSLSIDHEPLRQLMGTVVPQAQLAIPATSLRAEGTLLITHWGISGPAVLRLSSYAARPLAEQAYRAPLVVNWAACSEQVAIDELSAVATAHPQKLLTSVRPFDMTSRLWTYLAERAVPSAAAKRWAELGRKDFNRLVATLTADLYSIAGRAPFRDEFVTCGGVALDDVFPNTLESRSVPGLFFAGEVLDIDAVTGGFNLQAAWTTAYTVAQAIAQR